MLVEKNGIVKELKNEYELGDYVLAGWKKIEKRKIETKDNDNKEIENKKGLVLNK